MTLGKNLFTIVIGASTDEKFSRIYVVMADTIQLAMIAALEADEETLGAVNNPEFELSPRNKEKVFVLKAEQAPGDYTAVVA